MLRLERSSPEGRINVVIRDKEHLFTKPFLLALTLAIAIHLTLILLFQITPFSLGKYDRVLAPIQVQSDSLSAESALAEWISPVQTLRGLPIPPPSHPMLLQQPKFLADNPITYTKIENSNKQAFLEIEQKVYQPEFTPMVFHPPQQPFLMRVSGILGNYELIDNGMKELHFPKFKLDTESTRVIFSVLAEGKTGKIVWFDFEEKTQSAALDKFAEGILRRIQFAKNLKSIFIDGKIEMEFNREKE